jgi:hypothetical protein
MATKPSVVVTAAGDEPADSRELLEIALLR